MVRILAAWTGETTSPSIRPSATKTAPAPVYALSSLRANVDPSWKQVDEDKVLDFDPEDVKRRGQERLAQLTMKGNSMQKTSFAGEAADRLAIRGLIDAYAHAADRKRFSEQAALFTDDGVIEVYADEAGKPIQVLHGRREIESAIGDALKPYLMTMHFNGQSVVEVRGDLASNESLTLAHHFFSENGTRMLLVMGIRYHDTIVRKGDEWLFSKRKLIIDWTDRRPSIP